MGGLVEMIEGRPDLRAGPLHRGGLSGGRAVRWTLGEVKDQRANETGEPEGHSPKCSQAKAGVATWVASQNHLASLKDHKSQPWGWGLEGHSFQVITMYHRG